MSFGLRAELVLVLVLVLEKVTIRTPRTCIFRLQNEDEDQVFTVKIKNWPIYQ
jgi:hypothetical protein